MCIATLSVSSPVSKPIPALISSPVPEEELPTILVLGDSLSAGYGLDASQGWVELLRQQLSAEYTIANASVSGDTSKGGLQRLPDLLQKHAPRVVIIELGGNDGLRGMSTDTLADNLSEAAKLSIEQGARVLLLETPLPPNYGRRYAQSFSGAFAAAAESCECPLVQWLQDIPPTGEYLQEDGVHPTEAAQALMLENVLPELQSLLEDES